MALRYHQGKYTPRNPGKYNGDVNNIIYRSGLERDYFRYCDTNPAVLAWNSEEVVVPYVSEVDGRVHRYFVDLYMKVQTKSGVIKEFIVEIKPDEQTRPPKPRKKGRKDFYAKRVETWVRNQSKWKAAEKYAIKRGMEFLILTEKHIR